MPTTPTGPDHQRWSSDRARLIALERQFLPLLIACLLPILLLPFTAKGGLIGRALLAVMLKIGRAHV